ncbi:MAG: PAP/fibrillin family protein [Dysgonamonadaceae bacterium]|jgi:hypothetical protein|nr:PAP/fibrillin family protein [Dysgonamonadaceae bacterium]
MKTKIFLIAVSALVSLTALTGCDPIGGGNYVTPAGVCAVVSPDYNFAFGGYPVLKSNVGYFAAPQLTGMAADSCIFIQQMKIDYDNQPSTAYTTATEIQPVGVPKRSLTSLDEIDSTDYILPLSNIQYVSSPYLDGRFFVSAEFTAKQGQGLDFRITKSSLAFYDVGATIDLCMQAKLIGDGTSGETATGSIFAFDLRPLFGYASDTTYQDYKYKYIKVRIKYVSSVVDGVGQFSNLTSETEPILITRFSDSY